jgi:outer membrane immunogenic protein
MSRTLAFAFAVVMLVTGRALAQGPNPEGPWKWSGFHVGLGLGGGVAVQTQTLNDIGLGTFSERTNGGGALATATVGYDWRWNSNVVAGAFVDLDISGLSKDDFSFMGLSLPFDHRYSASVGGRIGYLTTPATLWYLASGYSRARIDYLLLGNVDFDGIFAGAGIEKRFARNLSTRAEYRYAHYFTEQLLDLCGCGSFDGEADVHTVRVMLVYSFGANAP